MSLPGVLVEHFQEFQALCAQRHSASRSADWFAADVAELDRRIVAHLDGLLSSAAASQPLLEEQLGGEDPESIFSAAYALLCLHTESAAVNVLSAFQSAPPELLPAFVEAFALAPSDHTFVRLQQLYESGTAHAACAAAEVLARRQKFQLPAQRLDEFFKHDDPFVRRTAWRIVARIRPHVSASASKERG